MQFIGNHEVDEILNSYPAHLARPIKRIRQLILETASETEGLEKLIETKKWGEPGYQTRHGSTIRLGAVRNNPTQYALYFTCTTSLIATFKMIYGEELKFEGNRAILFNVEEDIPISPVKHCISLALKYHKIKHLPMLGV